jgi:diaminopimelate decarboxylase
LRPLFAREDSATICLDRQQLEVLVKSIASRISELEGSSYQDFKPEVYLRLNPDVKASKMNPYEHFVKHGIGERRKYKQV